jgi:hypothetical protein
MSLLILLILVFGVMIFFMIPQRAKFRATLGIPQTLESGGLSLLQKLKLLALGLKTPFLNTLTLFWTFLMTEGDELRGFAWDQIMTHEHAVWVATCLWFASIWSHFGGLNAAAATPPVVAPLPPAIPIAPKG